MLKSDILSRRRYILITLLLILIAAFPRLYHLNSLGFYGDEETTSLPSLALAEGKGNIFPSGMPYRRALPQTWINAISAHFLGKENELAYRLPAALFGIFTIPLLFLSARPFFGTRIAFIASLLLSLSEWHILISREARMYAPFLFFYLATSFTILYWTLSGKKYVFFSAIILFILTISIHALGIFAILFFLLPILFFENIHVKQSILILTAIISGIFSHLYSKYFVAATYHNWILKNGKPLLIDPIVNINHKLPSFINLPFWIILFLLLFGLTSGALIAHLSWRSNESLKRIFLRKLNHYGLVIITSISFSFGQIYAGLLTGCLFLTSYSGSISALIKNCRFPIIGLILIIICWFSYALINQGLFIGIKSLLYFPFPYLINLFEIFPGIILFSILMCFYVINNFRNINYRHIIVCIYATIIPIFIIGIFSRWGGLRYLVQIYPFLLILASAGIVIFISKLPIIKNYHNNILVMAIAIFVVSSGILGGHGIPQSWQIMNIKYGDSLDIDMFGIPVYPDHKGPGVYVKNHLQSNDIIIAEDVLQQKWYIGKVHYWLRNENTHHNYIYKDNDGAYRDIYVNSLVATNNDLQKLSAKKEFCTWIITSAETSQKPDYYLTKKQQLWLSNIKNKLKPVFVGRDNITEVYRLNCD